MSQSDTAPASVPLGKWHTLALCLTTITAFHLAYLFRPLAFLMVVFLYALAELSRIGSFRNAARLGILIGLATYGPQLSFFWGIFGPAAIALWLLLALGPALFLALIQASRRFLPPPVFLLSLPVFWTGIEFGRSELISLRFSWLNVGYAFTSAFPIHWLGMYGVAFAFMVAVAASLLLSQKYQCIVGGALLTALALFANWPPPPVPPATTGPLLVGIQLEQPSEREILSALESARGRHPAADLFILSEYTLASPPTPALLNWCRDNHRFLIVGGMRLLDENAGHFRDTAFVVGPDGLIAFEQAKSVPIQFMQDGLPAQSQSLWLSPWGKIGLCVCYDLSYRRVTDRLIALGARAIIVPTMDVQAWGAHEHILHSLVGQTRAAEYGVPIVRLASSGISQLIDPTGAVIAYAPFPGQGSELVGRLQLASGGRIPPDHFIGPASTLLSGLLALVLAFLAAHRRWRLRQAPASP